MVIIASQNAKGAVLADAGMRHRGIGRETTQHSYVLSYIRTHLYLHSLRFTRAALRTCGRSNSNFLSVSLTAAAALVLVGCVPFPSRVKRSPEVRGHIANAVTGAPVSLAKVAFIDHPSLAATADDHADFIIRETKVFELFRPIGMCGPECFLHDWLPPNIRVTSEGYTPMQIFAYDEKTVDFSRYNPKPPNAWMIKGPLFLKPILLQPQAQ